MEKLTLDSMVQGLGDLERKQYEVLGALKERREHFSHNRLYPWLGELVQLEQELRGLLANRDDMARHIPQRLKDVDAEHLNLVYEPAGTETPEFARVMDLVQWALPLVEAALEEGRGIFDFVEQHIAIDEVGIVPSYREEGYWFVPDLRAGVLYLLRYRMSIFSASNERFRSLKTAVIGSLREGAVRRPAESLKLEILKTHPELPNPATFLCEVDIDFPFAETLLPVAKRKLMARLAA